MATDRLARLSGAAFLGSGVALALFTVLHPWDRLAGAEVGRSGAWALAHAFHFVAGLLACFGLVALLPVRRRAFESGAGAAAFGAALAGSVLFTGTGLFTAFFWPDLANTAPHVVELTGPIFTPPHPAFLATALLLSGGWIGLAAILWRARVLSGPSALVLAIGFLMFMVPPAPLTPLPWVFFVGAGVVAGVGLASLGVSLLGARAAMPAAAATATR